MTPTTTPQTRDNLAAWLAWQAAALALLQGRVAANDQSFAVQDATERCAAAIRVLAPDTSKEER